MTGFSRPTHVVVTGATGALGAHVISALRDQGAAITVVGRDVSALARSFPDDARAGWEDLEAVLKGATAVVHLAVRNNDRPGSLEQFYEANVLLTTQVARACTLTGTRMIMPSTFRAFDPVENDFYGRTKLLAEHAAEAYGPAALTVVRLPAVRADAFSGRLSFLNFLPPILRPLGIVGSLRPEVTMDRAAGFLAAAAMCADAVPKPAKGPLLLFEDKSANRWYRTSKRTLDLIAAAAIVLLLWWALAGFWMAVRATSRGPGLFVQTRVGRGGVPFRCYKFRTMSVGTAESATHLIPRSAVTPLGRFMRRWKIDELPQAVNLVNGTMTLVGPRPCLPAQEELIATRRALGVDMLVPGITGYAQIRDIDMSDPARLAQADYAYKARRSLIEDLRILLATMLGRGLADRTSADLKTV